MIQEIISGGQTGADLGGLLAAEELRIPTGGWAPKGWKTEIGAAPWLGQRFHLLEHTSSDYNVRTAANVHLADVTLIFGKSSPGSELTKSRCQKSGKPFMWNMLESESAGFDMYKFLTQQSPKIINIAGNRESVYPGICELVRKFLVDLLPLL